MPIYTNNKFKGFWPVGSAAVVVAVSKSDALGLLNRKLREMGLKGDAKREDMILLKTDKPQVVILCDGNY